MKNNFKNFTEMLEHIKSNEKVIGILEYGGRTYENENIKDGDYDFSIITTNKLSETIIGLHFYVAGIPVDCALLTIDFFNKEKPSSFDLMYTDCRILFDRFGDVETSINNIKKKWNNNRKFTEMDISKTRYVLSHRLSKIEHRLDNEIFSSFIIYQTIQLIIVAYGEINNLPIGKEKFFLQHMQDNNPTLFNLIKECYSESKINNKFLLLKEASIHITKPFGGLWKEDEVIFRNMSDITDETEKNNILSIFNSSID